MAEKPEIILTNLQKIEIARFRAELHESENFAVFSLEKDVWLIYDTDTGQIWSEHEDDPDAETIEDCEYFDEWTS